MDLFDDETDDRVAPSDARFCATGNDASHRPRTGYALDRLTRFAYTSEETRDRLRLIALALDDPSDDVEAAALASARDKLEQWLQHLTTVGATQRVRG